MSYQPLGIANPGCYDTENQDDQRRIATARQAIIDGADHVVVGRPIRDAADPIAVVESMQREIRDAGVRD